VCVWGRGGACRLITPGTCVTEIFTIKKIIMLETRKSISAVKGMAKAIFVTVPGANPGRVSCLLT